MGFFSKSTTTTTTEPATTTLPESTTTFGSGSGSGAITPLDLATGTIPSGVIEPDQPVWPNRSA